MAILADFALFFFQNGILSVNLISISPRFQTGFLHSDVPSGSVENVLVLSIISNVRTHPYDMIACNHLIDSSPVFFRKYSCRIQRYKTYLSIPSDRFDWSMVSLHRTYPVNFLIALNISRILLQSRQNYDRLTLGFKSSCGYLILQQ